jgi:hypothetical protein
VTCIGVGDDRPHLLGTEFHGTTDSAVRRRDPSVWRPIGHPQDDLKTYFFSGRMT